MKKTCLTRVVMYCLFRCLAVVLELPFSTAYWPCLMLPHTGEVYSGGAGKPGAGQKVFCPGAEAEQPKHEGVVRSVHGEYYFA